MSEILGFDNTKQQTHRIVNTLDGSLTLRTYADRAEGKTVLTVNGSPVRESDAGEGKAPFFLGEVSLPRGEFTISAESGCAIGRLLLSEDASPGTAEEFDLLWMNRKRDEIFERDPVTYTPEVLALLRRHGFLYREPRDTADGLAPSGVPLGGMGCGKLEIASDGLMTAFTGNNNQDCPVYRMPGSFFALSAGGQTRILRSDPLGLPYEPLASRRSDLEFPIAGLEFSDPALPVSARIEAFSAHIPGNAADSALPCVFFEVALKNGADREEDAAFCFSWENLVNVGGSMMVRNRGERLLPLCYHTWNCSYPWSDRRMNRCERTGQSIVFSASDDRGNPSSFGEHLLWCSESDAEAVPDRSILPEDERAFAEYLSGKTDTFAPHTDEFRAGAWIVRRRLGPGGSASFRFVLAWYMPVHIGSDGQDYGVAYADRFSSVRDVLAYALENRDRLYTGTAGFNAILSRSSLPAWFGRRLLDDRFVVNTCSWYDREGNFSINEAPTGMAGCLGTLDQRTASQVYYTTFFPELDARELELFRQSQAEDGMCAHEIGFEAMTLEARPFSKWPDLACSYVIEVFHHAQRTGDTEFLKRHWPHIKRALCWTRTLDDADCGIPLLCTGRGTTYDNQFWPGISAFISTIQIAAYRIGAQAARLLGEYGCAEEWEKLARKAGAYREARLWNREGGYYNNVYDPVTDKTDDSCFIASLAGEWAILRAGLEPVIPKERIGRIAAAVAEQCIGDEGITDQGGRRYETDGFLQYPMAYLASASLYGGNAETAWRTAEITERVISRPGVSTHFDQGLTYRYTGERHGLPYYMTAPASWNMLEALSGVRADRLSGTLALDPYRTDGLRIPVFLTGCAFELTTSADGAEWTLSPLYSNGEVRFRSLTVPGRMNFKGKPGEYDGERTVFLGEFDPGLETIVLKEERF